MLAIGDEQLTGTLGLLSRTGGTIRLAKRFAAGTFGNIGVKTISGKFHATIEFLQMAGANAQAFRFVQMGPTAQKRLEDALSKMRAQGLGIKKSNALSGFVDLARRIIARE
ncbi:MAG TPA: hypothetical protein VI685_04120 [Candidatus Angelobacter sp.]